MFIILAHVFLVLQKYIIYWLLRVYDKNRNGFSEVLSKLEDYRHGQVFKEYNYLK